MHRFLDSKRQGDKAEYRFRQLAEKEGYTITKTGKWEDMHHKDFWIEKDGTRLSVDVKSMKYISRRSEREPQDKLFWIELVNGKRKGWIFSKVDLIAFEVKEGFLLCWTDKLREFVMTKCKEEVVSDPRDATYKHFTRQSFCGESLLTLIARADLSDEVIFASFCGGGLTPAQGTTPLTHTQSL